jgi:hypothetical protein
MNFVKNNDLINIKNLLNLLNNNNNDPEFNWEYTELNTDTVYDSIFDSNSNNSKTENGETTRKKRIRKGSKLKYTRLN